MKLVSLILF